MRNQVLAGLLAATMMIVADGTPLARSVTIAVPMNDITVKNGEGGSYYVVAVNPPTDIVDKRLDSVFIEFVVDVTSGRSVDDAMLCRVGVFPLMEAFTGANPAYATEVPSVRTLPGGENQKVIADITDIVRGWMNEPSTNHGLVIGTLAGPDVGTISLQNDALAPGAALRVTFFYQNRFGGRVSTQ